ncbi:MAG: hypothetical protein O3B13_09410 [Planctomycetota bacterium]|nr:hypothetical protein [Planctomycetota bacterium]MDA1163306.1 hypothetical protein [Planctomycetota bacterium]
MRHARRGSIFLMGISCLAIAIVKYGNVHWASTTSCLLVAALAIPAAFWVKD